MSTVGGSRPSPPTPSRAAGLARGPAARPCPGGGPHRLRQDTGLGRFPSRQVAINAIWLHPALTACDLIAWTQTTHLHGDLAVGAPKALRYRLLHVAARITRGQRRRWLRIAGHWPWRDELATRVRPACRPSAALRS